MPEKKKITPATKSKKAIKPTAKKVVKKTTATKTVAEKKPLSKVSSQKVTSKKVISKKNSKNNLKVTITKEPLINFDKKLVVDLKKDHQISAPVPVIETVTKNQFQELTVNSNINFDDIIETKKFNQEFSDNDYKEELLEEVQVLKKTSPALFRRIAVSFLSLVAILLGVIAYFSWSSLEVKVWTKSEIIKDSLSINVYDKGDDYVIADSGVRGLVKQLEIGQSKVYSVAGTEVIGEEVVGKIMLINNSPKAQPLVASTRLLTASNKLFRLKNSITIPANGQIEVEVYADKPSAEMVIDAEKLIIPGLWAGLQDKIYAQSSVGEIKHIKKYKKIVSQSDIDAAIGDLKQALILKMKTDIDLAYTNFSKKIYYLDEQSIKQVVDAKIGDEKEQFSVSLNAVVNLVAFDDQKVYQLARARLNNLLPINKKLISLNKSDLNFNLSSIDLTNGEAVLQSEFSGQASLKNGDDLVRASTLAGLSQVQINRYLNSIPELKTYQLKFTPSFVHSAPSLVDKIKVQVQE